jgi:hypothetical protein
MLKKIHHPMSRAELLARNPVVQALARLPIPKSVQTTQSLNARLSYKATTKGKATPTDREYLAGVCNVVMFLTEKHYAPKDLAAVIDAQNAIIRAGLRFSGGKPWNFDDKGRKAMLDVLDMFEELLAILDAEVALALIGILNSIRNGDYYEETAA